MNAVKIRRTDKGSASCWIEGKTAVGTCVIEDYQLVGAGVNGDVERLVERAKIKVGRILEVHICVIDMNAHIIGASFKPC